MAGRARFWDNQFGRVVAETIGHFFAAIIVDTEKKMSQGVWEKPVCWTCEENPLLTSVDDKIWQCLKCSDKYLRCFQCHNDGIDTFECLENLKGQECRGCENFFCLCCVQNTGKFIDDTSNESNWLCNGCAAKIVAVHIQINNVPHFSEKEGVYYRLCCEGNSFSIRPTTHNPTGHISFAKVESKPTETFPR